MASWMSCNLVLQEMFKEVSDVLLPFWKEEVGWKEDGKK